MSSRPTKRIPRSTGASTPTSRPAGSKASKSSSREHTTLYKSKYADSSVECTPPPAPYTINPTPARVQSIIRKKPKSVHTTLKSTIRNTAFHMTASTACGATPAPPPSVRNVPSVPPVLMDRELSAADPVHVIPRAKLSLWQDAESLQKLKHARPKSPLSVHAPPFVPGPAPLQKGPPKEASDVFRISDQGILLERRVRKAILAFSRAKIAMSNLLRWETVRSLMPLSTQVGADGFDYRPSPTASDFVAVQHAMDLAFHTFGCWDVLPLVLEHWRRTEQDSLFTNKRLLRNM